MTAPADPGDFLNAPTLSTPVAAPYRLDADLYDARFLVLYRALDKAAVGLDAFSVQDGIVTPALIEAQPAWSTVAFSSGSWSPATLAYRKDSAGRVRVRGTVYTISAADIPVGTTIATLPAGFRPGADSYFTVNKIQGGGFPSVTAHSAVKITTAGVVSVTGNPLFFDNGNGQRSMFPNIEFLAEN